MLLFGFKFELKVIWTSQKVNLQPRISFLWLDCQTERTNEWIEEELTPPPPRTSVRLGHFQGLISGLVDSILLQHLKICRLTWSSITCIIPKRGFRVVNRQSAAEIQNLLGEEKSVGSTSHYHQVWLCWNGKFTSLQGCLKYWTTKINLNFKVSAATLEYLSGTCWCVWSFQRVLTWFDISFPNFKNSLIFCVPSERSLLAGKFFTVPQGFERLY